MRRVARARLLKIKIARQQRESARRVREQRTLAKALEKKLAKSPLLRTPADKKTIKEAEEKKKLVCVCVCVCKQERMRGGLRSRSTLPYCPCLLAA